MAGLALVLICLAWRVWQVWRVARPLLDRIETVRALVDDPATVDPTTLVPMVHETHADLVALRDEARPFLALASRLGGVPGVGPDLQAMPPLLDVAIDLSGAGDVALDGLAPLLSLVGAGETSTGEDALSMAVHALADARPQLEAARALVERATQRRADVDAAQLSPRLARWVSLLDQSLPLARAGAEAALMAPDLLGVSGPRTYLVIAQNSDELRPTGGFITAAGPVTVDDGKIVTFYMRDSYRVDDFGKPYDRPPAPLYEYMWSELWVFRDANWSPDFPTSAQKAAELYTYGQGLELDGVIAFDQQAAARLIGALGPIAVDGWDEPVIGENLIELVRAAWDPSEQGVDADWSRTRKDFIGQLAQQALDRVRRQPGAVDWVGLGRAVWQVLQEHHVLIYLEDPPASAWLGAQGWDGALRATGGDYLMAVDANLGFNKVNPNIEVTLEYQITLRVDGSASAVLTAGYQNNGHGDAGVCEQRATYGEGENITYEGLMDGCYWNYLRVYAPEGSLLRTASRHPIPGTYLLRGMGTDGDAEILPDESGKAVFAQFLVVESGRALTTRFCYDLPQVAYPSEGRWHYSLLIQKQAGTDSTSVRIRLVLPPGAHVSSATPSPRMIDGEELEFVLKLEADTPLEIMYEFD